MATLLLKLQGNRTFNRTFFPPRLYIFDDLVIYKKRKMILWVDEITYSYNQIAQIRLKQGIIFADIEVATTGTEYIWIRFVPKGKARLAKKIIDQKIYHAHARIRDSDGVTKDKNMNTFEKSLSRLEELTLRGKISKREYKKKKAELLKKIR